MAVSAEAPTDPQGQVLKSQLHCHLGASSVAAAVTAAPWHFLLSEKKNINIKTHSILKQIASCDCWPFAHCLRRPAVGWSRDADCGWRGLQMTDKPWWMKMEMLFSILPLKGNQIWRHQEEEEEEQDRVEEAVWIFAFLQLIRYVPFFCGQKKWKWLFKVVKVERIQAWWLRNYSSGRGTGWLRGEEEGAASGRASPLKLTRRPSPGWKDHMWLTLHQTDGQTESSNYLLSHWEVVGKKGQKCRRAD